MTQTAYCHEHGLSRDAFQYWKRRLKETGPANRFVEVSLPRESLTPSVTSIIEILVGSRFRVQVPDGIQSEHLRTVLTVLAEL